MTWLVGCLNVRGNVVCVLHSQCVVEFVAGSGCRAVLGKSGVEQLGKSGVEKCCVWFVALLFVTRLQSCTL